MQMKNVKVDLEHAKKQIQKETIESNKKVWQRYSDALISAAFARNLLEFDGPHDPSFDMSAIKDPLKESEGIRERFVSRNDEVRSSLALQQRGRDLRTKPRGDYADSIVGINTHEYNRVIDAAVARVEAEHAGSRGNTTYAKCLKMQQLPASVETRVRAKLRTEGQSGTVPMVVQAIYPSPVWRVTRRCAFAS